MKSFLILAFLFISSTAFSQTETTEQPTTQNAEVEIIDENEGRFYDWVENFKKEAVSKYKISQKTVDEAFKYVKYNPKVVKADRNQAEFVHTFWRYHDRALSDSRIKKGKEMLTTYKTLLKNVSEQYGVPKEIIVAFWGLETNYGQVMGSYNLIDALATLAFDPRRSKFFTNELVEALRIIDKGHVKAKNLKGSWAGAFGNFQFMPSTFKAYAVDGNGDGKINLTSDIRDAMHSAANYLSKMGWDDKYIWGRAVIIDDDNKDAWSYINSSKWEPLKIFSDMGVKKLNGSPVANADIKAQLIAPNGIYGPKFVVYDNFRYIMRWNASTSYALSIGLLADALKNNETTKFNRPDNWDKNKTITTDQIKEIQTKLKGLDLLDSEATGTYGRKTMRAIKTYQQMLLDGDKKVSRKNTAITNYPSGNVVFPDGYPSPDLYEQMFPK